MSELSSLFGLLEGGPHSPTSAAIALALLMAFVSGQAVAWIYVWSHAGVSYSRSFVQSLVLIAVVVALVMIIVGSNVIVAFGLFGAMAIIRFRNVLKDTRDTTFIFMALALGIGAGTWNVQAVLIGTVLFAAVMMGLYWTSFGTRQLHDALLRFEAPRTAMAVIDSVFSRHCRKAVLISQLADEERATIDYSYRLLLRDPRRSEELVDDLKTMEGVRGVSLLLQEDQSEI